MQKLSNNFTVVRDLKLAVFKRKWRKVNKNNYTSAGTIFPIDAVNVNRYTYGILNVIKFGNKYSKLKIGAYCSIAPQVTFLLSGEHNYKTVSTYPFNSRLFNIDETITNGNIVIDDDVWIGYGTTILSGVKIGQGAVVGAKSIVAKDIPPYAIYAGNKIIKYRFNQKIIDELIKIDFKNLDKEFIQNNKDLLYEELNELNYKQILNNLPKKEKNEEKYN